MKEIIAIFLLLVFSLMMSKTHAQEGAQLQNDLNKGIKNKEVVRVLTKSLAVFPENTQVSIALINGNETVYLGVLRKNNTLTVINNKDRVFEIGSITKVFTTVLFSSLILQEKIAVNETLQQQFDFSIKKGNEITLKQLANHTSGLERLPSNIFSLFALTPNNPYVNYTPKLLEEYLKNNIKTTHATGTKSVYSNLGVGLLGYILTKKTDLSFEDLLKKEIFTPLKMNHSTTLLSKVDTTKLVKGRDVEGEIASNWSFTDALVGAGGIKSTMVDMVKFVKKNLENNPVYNLPQKTTFSINDKRKVGLGWQILEKENAKYLWHNGGTGGYRSSLMLNKKQQKAVIILSNVSAFHPKSNLIDLLCFDLLKTF